MTGPATGWLALALLPIVAALGWVLRRYVKRAFAARMRVHYALGYAALGIATIHVFASASSMGGTSSAGIWLATLALLGLGWQALLGSNLQSPGSYRATQGCMTRSNEFRCLVCLVTGELETDGSRFSFG